MKKIIIITFLVLTISGAVLAAEITDVIKLEENTVSEETIEIPEMAIAEPVEDMGFVTGLVKQGYEADWLADIYDFYLTCGEDITIIKSIYDASERYDINGRNWIETSYNLATGGVHGELGLNDIILYVSKGASIEDIEAANVMCRSGVGTIQEILDRVIEGETIEKISYEIYGNEGTTVEAMAKMKKMGLEKESDLRLAEEKIVLKFQDTELNANSSVTLSQDTILRYPEYSTDKLSNAEKLSEDKGIDLDTVLKEYKETGKYSKYIDR